uniref:Uncharacterized protein n=1 Tax=Aplanochytrium stocchinoi TaxID=215587 RepID=A0A7S3V0A3_9STRA|mmetsp:Transcript_17805/g.21744  ORF Transcript_17805/g.21744 Transcript_17805/m.21744 type:complete len:129 (+) Transcript_17805:158-544(+)
MFQLIKVVSSTRLVNATKKKGGLLARRKLSSTISPAGSKILQTPDTKKNKIEIKNIARMSLNGSFNVSASKIAELQGTYTPGSITGRVTRITDTPEPLLRYPNLVRRKSYKKDHKNRKVKKGISSSAT